ncbi:MAG TPA: bifunctional nuclease family protein [Persephonella sp.]|nr:bifunctional nuclease family protein [Persephonella sp.]
MIQVKVRNIGLDSLTGSPIVMLANVQNEDEIFPIWIGVSEAEGIILKQSGVETPRPLTYDLVKNIIEALGGVVKHVAIVDKKDNAYIAEIVIEKEGEELHIDSRPSDAINIALRFDAPIYLEETVVQKVNIKEILEASKKHEQKETETAEVQEVKDQKTEVLEAEPETDKELEEFRKMLENIKPEDFAIKPEDKKEG